MSAERILCISRVVFDDLTMPDGTDRRNVLGGAGFWAAMGAATQSDTVDLLSKVGPDFADHYAQLRSLGVGDGFLESVDLPTSRTTVTYPQGDERVEHPVGGWPAHVAMRGLITDIPPGAPKPDGVYIFRDDHPGFWSTLWKAQEAWKAKLLWEVPAAVCRTDQAGFIRSVCERVDMLSINYSESVALFGRMALSDMVGELLKLGSKVVALRLGSRGALVLADGDIVYSRPGPTSVQDPTGAGNAFSGALLAAITSGNDLDEAARAAMGAAAMALAQVGPPPTLAEARSVAQRQAQLVQQYRWNSEATVPDWWRQLDEELRNP